MQIHIPSIANGANTLLSICVWSEFLSQRTDQVIDSAVAGVARTSQRYAGEMFPCKYPGGGGSQGMQDIKFRCRATDRLSIALDCPRSCVKYQVIDRQEGTAEPRRLTAAQHRADSC